MQLVPTFESCADIFVGSYNVEYGQPMAIVGTAEKGYFDVRVDVASPGGHSSVPPAHTSIGILSSLLVHLEENPYEIKLKRGTPIYQQAQCLAHAPDLPKSVRRAIRKSAKSDKALKEVEKALIADNKFKSLVGTTQAIDLIGGGVKTNALPESAWAVVNHRIATDRFVYCALIKIHWLTRRVLSVPSAPQRIVTPKRFRLLPPSSTFPSRPSASS